MLAIAVIYLFHSIRKKGFIGGIHGNDIRIYD